ncbi:Leucine Rich Repeat family protein [Trichomonas vaginalis G3]|uniref:Leucine Rich Repeat family protein n=1 Tax=Trichomonas vaginalis (strain ATCC PRA-98 / G3) TaxID=412133 RepID=A2F0M6_TRIV3|nr:uncharacterized protein TVAGG3_0928850 [Trichomonas vaginalis G3]EAY01541.1 Leucine Rich Repeat family protein [Trichomonas vaginalis G3]KAI5485681.1 cAMP biosynthetic process [Trichomonas vaginalis G3]|eukprot:XP_001330312.1 hypothetical protein [Trichomonas vaginalis G3]
MDPNVFLNPNLTGFDFAMKNIPLIPYCPDLLQKISRARFVNCGLLSIPPGLECYKCISIIDLTENLLQELDKDSFKPFENLQSLTLTANNFSEFKLNLPPMLITLDLSFNPNLNINDIWELDVPNLEVIKLSHCGIKALPEARPSWLQTVRTIHLDGNFLTDLAPYFDEFENLTELSLFGNCIKNLDTSLLPQQFKLLNLYFNYIEDWDGEEPLNTVTLNLNTNPFKSFPLKLLETVGLRALTLSHCDIDGELDFEFPEALAALDISFNNITSLGATFISSMHRLTALNASNNQISQISDSFPQRLALSRLVLDHNQISTLPESFKNLTNLDQLSMVHNLLHEIPPISCSHLRIFNVSFNQLEELPDCFSNWSFLSDFNVSFNRLSTLPRSLSACRKIIEFNISGNKFKVFPRCLFSYSQLRTLIASNNELSTLPQSLGSFFFLTTFDGSNNHFSTVPSYFGQLSTLRILSFSHNCISSLPADFQLPPVNVVDFSYNNISSFDYQCPTAQSVNLDCNKLTNFNPANFPAVRFISINNNPLSCTFPSLLIPLFSITTLTAFEMLSSASLPSEIPPVRFHLVTDHHISNSQRFGIGYSATMGVRPNMEDVITFQTYPNDQHLFGLFDGHQGNVAAATSAICLHNELLQNAVNAPDDQLPAAITNCYTAVNQKLKMIGTRDGCTAISAFIRKNKCYTVGIGDSRIVLVKKNSSKRLTVDYKPTMRSEYERLRKCGLTVNSEGRIGRKLAVARTLGDFWCEGPGLYVPPDVSSFEINEEEDLALIIACDGVWDVIQDDDAAEIVRNSENAQDAATTLRNVAFALGSKDNISAMIVFFDSKEKGLQYTNNVKELPPVKEEIDNDDTLDIGAPVAQLPQRRRRR